MSKKKQSAASDKMITRMVTKALPVTLTDAEMLQYGKDIARAHAERDRIDGDLDAIKSDYKGKIAEQDAAIGKLSGCLHSGMEVRDVACEEIKNWTQATVTVRRNDTGETIESRPMREDEKSMELSFPESDDSGDQDA